MTTVSRVAPAKTALARIAQARAGDRMADRPAPRGVANPAVRPMMACEVGVPGRRTEVCNGAGRNHAEMHLSEAKVRATVSAPVRLPRVKGLARLETEGSGLKARISGHGSRVRTLRTGPIPTIDVSPRRSTLRRATRFRFRRQQVIRTIRVCRLLADSPLKRARSSASETHVSGPKRGVSEWS